MKLKIKTKTKESDFVHFLEQDLAEQEKHGERMTNQYMMQATEADRGKSFTQITISNISSSFHEEFDKNKKLWVQQIAEKYTWYIHGYPAGVLEDYEQRHPENKKRIKKLGNITLKVFGVVLKKDRPEKENSVWDVWQHAINPPEEERPDGSKVQDKQREWFPFEFTIKAQERGGEELISEVRGVIYYFNSFQGVESMPVPCEVKRQWEIEEIESRRTPGHAIDMREWSLQEREPGLMWFWQGILL